MIHGNLELDYVNLEYLVNKRQKGGVFFTEEQRIFLDSLFGLRLFNLFLFRVAPWLRMRNVSLSRRNQFKWDSNFIAIASEGRDTKTT